MLSDVETGNNLIITRMSPVATLLVCSNKWALSLGCGLHQCSSNREPYSF